LRLERLDRRGHVAQRLELALRLFAVRDHRLEVAAILAGEG
jgi:hypothetical protein